MGHRQRLAALHAGVIAQKIGDWRRGRRVVRRTKGPPVVLSSHVVGNEISLRRDDEVALACVVNFPLLDESAQSAVEDVLTGDGYS